MEVIFGFLDLGRVTAEGGNGLDTADELEEVHAGAAATVLARQPQPVFNPVPCSYHRYVTLDSTRAATEDRHSYPVAVPGRDQ